MCERALDRRNGIMSEDDKQNRARVGPELLDPGGIGLTHPIKNHTSLSLVVKYLVVMP